MSDNKGFTMIETLFVLSIICFLSLLTMNLHIPSKQDDLVIQEISTFFYQAKMDAMVNKQTVQVVIEHEQLLYSYGNEQKKYRVENDSYFEDYRFTYNEFGNIKTAKTVHYYLHHQHYQFVFQVGSGCFYVRK